MKSQLKNIMIKTIKLLAVFILFSFALSSEGEKIIELIDGNKVTGVIIKQADTFIIVKTGYGELNIPRNKILFIRNQGADEIKRPLSIGRTYNQEARWRTIWSGMSITNSLYGWGVPYILGIEESQMTFGFQFLMIGGSFYAGYKYTQEMDLPLGRFQLQTIGAELASLSFIPFFTMIGPERWWNFDEDGKLSLMYLMAAIPYGVIKADQYYHKHQLTNGQASLISHGINLGLFNSYLSIFLLHPDDVEFTENHARLYTTLGYAGTLASGYYAHRFIDKKSYTEDDAQFISTASLLGFFNSLNLLSILESDNKHVNILTMMAGVNGYAYVANKLNNPFNLEKGQSFIIGLGSAASVCGWWGIGTIFDIESDELWTLGNMVSSSMGWYFTHKWVSGSLIKSKVLGSTKLRFNPTVLMSDNKFFPGIQLKASF